MKRHPHYYTNASTSWHKASYHSSLYGGIDTVIGILVNVTTGMWAKAQPDGRPAEHRWRPLFNAAKFD